ncbi:hypothetical protein [Actinoplanes sp. NPDC048796]|uniref:hypothetical protein n=1 Tax=Actinoplanes sp. NPDC048796 TaxID=3155640 RepID=UPI0034053263
MFSFRGRLVLGSLVATLLTAGLTGCADGDTATASPTISASTAVTASPTSSKTSSSPRPLATMSKAVGAYSTTALIAEPVIGKGVAQKFGAANVQRTYGDVVKFLRAETFKMDRLKPKAKYAVADFRSAELHMHPGLLKEWRKTLKKALAGDENEAGEVQVLTYFNAYWGGYKFATNGPQLVNEQIGSPVLYVDEETNLLAINLSYSADLRMARAGVTYRRPFSKQITLKVKPGEQVWSMDDFSGSWTISAPLPE